MLALGVFVGLLDVTTYQCKISVGPFSNKNQIFSKRMEAELELHFVLSMFQNVKRWI